MLDERALGVAGVAIALRAPVLLALALAIGVTTLVRTFAYNPLEAKFAEHPFYEVG